MKHMTDKPMSLVAPVSRSRPAVGAAASSGNVAILLDDVSVTYGGFAALKNFTLEVSEGELLTVLGPSGSGKSTLLNVIAGSVYPDNGRIRFGNEDITFLPSHKRRVGMVFQRYSLFPNRTVAENVAFPLEIRKIDEAQTRKLVAEALELVGLSDRAGSYPTQISGGQAQRAALARAIVFNPAIMLMDEPLGALDRALRKNLQYQIRALQQRLRVPTLYVTHDQEEAMSLSDRIAIVRDGEIEAQGSPRELYQHPKSVWVANFLGDANCIPTRGLTRPGWAALADGSEVPVSNPQDLEGAMQILVRPEGCQIARAPVPGISEQRARVEWVEFLGPVQRVRLRMLDLQLTAQLSGRAGEFAAGDDVFVGWDRADATLVQDR